MRALLVLLLAVTMVAAAQEERPKESAGPVIDSSAVQEGPGQDAAEGNLKIGPTPKALQVTVNLTATPATGTCPFDTNLQWSAVNASVCSKSGAWSGSAAASGSEVQSVNAAQQTYTLTCSSNTDTRTLSWTNPTQNVDGSAVSLKGNKVFHSATSAGVEGATAIVLQPQTQTYLLAGLPAGPRYVGIKATSTGSIDSAMSNIATATITLPAAAKTVQTGCTTPPQPKPPTAVTIASTVWDSVPGREGIHLGRDVGTIVLESRCLGASAITIQNGQEYWAVPRVDPPTKLYRKPRSSIVLGQCALKCLEPDGNCVWPQTA